MTGSCGDPPKVNFEEESFGKDMNEEEIEEIDGSGEKRTRERHHF